MLKSKISVIVPIYNVEKYLKECIDSIIFQTYTNLEILLINDGSTDSSKKICEEYVNKDSRIKLFNKVNGGLSSARNFGIKKATGDYIIFIDSDDFIEKNMIEELVFGCECNNCDISVIGVYKYFDNKNIYKESKFIYFGKVDNSKALENMMLNGFYACNKLFKRYIFEKNSFESKLYEDIYLIPYIVEKSQNIYFLNEYGYYYRQREKSIVHTEFNEKKMDYYYAANKVYTSFIDNDRLKDATIAFYSLTLSNLISDVYSQRKKFNLEYKLFCKELIYLKKEIRNNKYIAGYKKIMLYLHMIHLTKIVNYVKSKK